MLTQKYDELERSYVCLREESKAGVTAYLDNDITDRLDGIGKLAGIPLHFATRYCIILASLKY